MCLFDTEIQHCSLQMYLGNIHTYPGIYIQGAIGCTPLVQRVQNLLCLRPSRMEHASGLEKRGSRVRSELSKHPAKVRVLSLSTDGLLEVFSGL